MKKILDASIGRIAHLESFLVFCWTGRNPVSVILLSTVRGSACIKMENKHAIIFSLINEIPVYILMTFSRDLK